MKSPVLKFFLIVALVVALVCAVFWRELSEAAADAAAGIVGDQVESGKHLNGDLHAITGARLDLERNDIHKLSVRDLQVGARSGQDVEVSFLLTNAGGSNDFPSLRVHLLNGRRKAVRQIEVAADDYSHTAVFTAERIKLNVALREGEASFTVEPFYKIEGGK